MVGAIHRIQRKRLSHSALRLEIIEPCDFLLDVCHVPVSSTRCARAAWTAPKPSNPHPISLSLSSSRSLSLSLYIDR